MDESTTPRPGGGRRRLGPGMTVFLVVDVLLVLAAAVALAAYFSGGDRPGDTPRAQATPSVSAPATPGPTPSGTPPATEAPGPGTFALPSGNIACEISESAATCTIADSAAEPATQEGCAGVVGPIVTVNAEGATTPCVQGALPGAAAPGTPVLEYGASTTVGDFTCTSSTSGATCRHDPSAAGFTLARAGHQLF
ncbi:hypothetical protein [Cellulomonas aerilata]|uniref:Uncharacterized protein n=1 Tax=Cellulomonas aerilata TaxID=515326 RepID=A0A512DC18_9CELL|nr:hypothetical protein [Cellulomonas aerilata]GEO34016.1 hypothetical protein CAE01nite_17410 [Cellulomonas aerilata]